MKKILVIAIVCLLGSFAAAAQTVKVNGTIVDEQNRPVEFVNVALISLPDSSFVTESTTDGKGKFALRATAGSDFLLRLSYIGYVGEQIVIRTPQGTVQMGDIILKEQSVALDEVVISGSNITQKVDRMVVVPTATAMKNSYNPYDLMLNLAIPHLKVDALGKGLEANGGSVQTRINGIVATSTEVAALLPKEIVRIEFIENPGERYGDSSLGAVVDIIVRRRETGGLVNIQATNAPHMLFSEDNVVAKFNHNKSQWGLFYNLSARNFKKTYTDIDETYVLENKTIPPACVGGGPCRPPHVVAETDMPVDAEIARGLGHIAQDRRTIRDRLGLGPRTERITQRIHVRIRPDSGIAEQIPCPAQLGSALEDDIGPIRALRLQVIARADTGYSGTDHDHVEMLRCPLCHHRPLRIPNIRFESLGKALGCDQKSFL